MLSRSLQRCHKLSCTTLDLDLPSNICDRLSRLFLCWLKLFFTILELGMPSIICALLSRLPCFVLSSLAPLWMTFVADVRGACSITMMCVEMSIKAENGYGTLSCRAITCLAHRTFVAMVCLASKRCLLKPFELPLPADGITLIFMSPASSCIYSNAQSEVSDCP